MSRAIPNHNRPWQPRDLTKMRRCAKDRLSARQAAKYLGRTTGAVKYKAMVEGVRFMAIIQPPGTQRTRKQRMTLSRIATRRHGANRRSA